mgnify:CR=1 FL=1
MDEEPGEPGQVAPESQPGHLGHGRGPADRRHAPLVDVPERPRVAPLEAGPDRPGDVPPLLYRHGRHPRERPAVRARAEGEVSDDEELGMPREGQVGLDGDAPGSVRRPAGRFGQRAENADMPEVDAAHRHPDPHEGARHQTNYGEIGGDTGMAVEFGADLQRLATG